MLDVSGGMLKDLSDIGDNNKSQITFLLNKL